MFVFLWQPGHFWPLSIYYRADYKAAGIPAISTLRDTGHIALYALGYNILTVSITYMLYFVTRLSVIYIIVMSAINAYLIYRSVAALKVRERQFFLGSFRLSIAYMLIFLSSLIVSSLVMIPHAFV